MSNLCNCTRPTRDGYTICDTCKADLEQHLAEMRWLNEQLDISLTRARAVTYNGAGGKSTETALPWNDQASRARRALKTELTRWVTILKTSNETNPTDRLTTIAAWHLNRLDRIAKHDSGWEIFDTITRASQRARAVVFAKPEPEIFLGKCDGRIEDDGDTITEHPCDGEVFARENNPTGECNYCRRAYDTNQRRNDLANQLEDHLCSISDTARLATYLGLEASRESIRGLLYRWTETRRILPHQKDANGTDLYRFGETRNMLEHHYLEKRA